jgi:hypothetical protein
LINNERLVFQDLKFCLSLFISGEFLFSMAFVKPEGGKSGQIPRRKVKYCALVAGSCVLPVRLNYQMN